jgi:hypothetical protein
MPNIKLEPHKEFKKAIVKVCRGRLTYGYYLLIDVCQQHYELEFDDAVEWVDYNIVGLACNGFNISYNQNASAIGRSRSRSKAVGIGKWAKKKYRK